MYHVDCILVSVEQREIIDIRFGLQHVERNIQSSLSSPFTDRLPVTKVWINSCSWCSHGMLFLNHVVTRLDC